MTNKQPVPILTAEMAAKLPTPYGSLAACEALDAIQYGTAVVIDASELEALRAFHKIVGERHYGRMPDEVQRAYDAAIAQEKAK